MNRAVVCSAYWFASLWGHSTVDERHAVGGAIGLALIAVLVVHSVVLRRSALDLVIRKIENNDFKTMNKTLLSTTHSSGLQLMVI